MLIKRDDQTNITFLKIYGEINRADVGDLKKTLEKLLDEQRYYAVLDMEEISFIGSHTIMTLLRMNREFLAAGGGIKLLKPRNVVKRFLSIGRVLELFDRYETRVDAIRSFQKIIQQDERIDDPAFKIRRAGRQQRAVLMRLIEILQKKGYYQIDEFYNELNRSSQLVFSIFRREITDHDVKQ